jgi:hypothetical protein
MTPILIIKNEIKAAEALGNRCLVAFCNKRTAEILMTSVSEIINSAKSLTRQVSVQLKSLPNKNLNQAASTVALVTK